MLLLSRVCVCCGQQRVAQGNGVVEGRRALVGGELALLAPPQSGLARNI